MNKEIDGMTYIGRQQVSKADVFVVIGVATFWAACVWVVATH